MKTLTIIFLLCMTSAFAEKEDIHKLFDNRQINVVDAENFIEEFKATNPDAVFRDSIFNLWIAEEYTYTISDKIWRSIVSLQNRFDVDHKVELFASISRYSNRNLHERAFKMHSQRVDGLSNLSDSDNFKRVNFSYIIEGEIVREKKTKRFKITCKSEVDDSELKNNFLSDKKEIEVKVYCHSNILSLFPL